MGHPNTKWLPYHVADGTDWWVAHYPHANIDRPTGPLCDGCHSVNYNIATKQVTEWNVGCEKCHGPGSEHVAHPTAKNIVNPDRLDYVRANDVCIQCHSQGRRTLPSAKPRSSVPIYYDWPVGYLPGDRLADYWHLEDAQTGHADFYYFPDGTAHKNRMQGNDFIQSTMYHRGVRCFDCHRCTAIATHPTSSRPATSSASLSHQGQPSRPERTVVTTHPPRRSSAGSQCTACHMPQIAQTLLNKQGGDIFVASHTFRFLSPVLTENSGIPNPCTSCHKDKTNAWAVTQLRSWKTTSPWRVAN